MEVHGDVEEVSVGTDVTSSRMAIPRSFRRNVLCWAGKNRWSLLAKLVEAEIPD